MLLRLELYLLLYLEYLCLFISKKVLEEICFLFKDLMGFK